MKKRKNDLLLGDTQVFSVVQYWSLEQIFEARHATELWQKADPPAISSLQVVAPVTVAQSDIVAHETVKFNV